MAEVVGEKKVNLQTNIYVNNDTRSVQTRAAADNIPEYAAKYVDDNNVVHPAAVLLTDPYGYDKEVHYSDDQPSAAQTRAAQTGEYQYLTAEEIANGQTRWSTNLRLLEVSTELDKKVQFAAKDSKDKLKCDLAKFPGYTFTFFIGPIPVAISITPNMFVKMDGKVCGCVETGFTYKYGNKFKGGISYVNGDWNPIKGFEETANKFDIIPAQAAFTLETGVGLYLGADILIYEAAGPEFAIGPRLGGELRIEGTPFKAPKDPKDLGSVEGKINLTINAVAGAKLKVLGYEIAETSVTIPLLGDDKDGWVLFKYPFDPEKDEAIHESPAEKKEAELVKTQMPKFLEVLAVIQQKNPSYYTEYVYLLNMMMTMKRWSHEQAEEEFLKQLIKDMPYFETTSTENMLTLMAGVQPRILKFYQDLEPKYKAFMGEQSWKEVQATLQGSPALEKYNNYFYRNFAIKMDLDLIHKQFVNDHKREPDNVTSDIEALVEYMKDFAKMYYLNSSKVQQMYNKDYVQMFIDYGKTVNGYNDNVKEQAAYETVLLLYTKRPNDYSNWNLNNGGGWLKRVYQNNLGNISSYKY